MFHSKLFIFLFLFSFTFFNYATAEDIKQGLKDYKAACVSCHGEKGQGDGPYSKKLKTPAPDLTQLTKSNGGKFPFEKIIRIIDGRTVIESHSRDMPIWGKHFQIAIDPKESVLKLEERAQRRIKSLVKYLETIQKL